MENNNFADSILNSAFTGLNILNPDNIDKVAEMLDKYGLRWTVKKENLLLPDGVDSELWGVVRQDTRKTFASCKEGYEPFQNSELAELLLRICDNKGYTIHSGGMFNGGGKVFLQINTEQIIKNLGENRTTVKGYITGINSHDMTTNQKWGFSNNTICCKNDFARMSQELKNSTRHTVTMRAKIEASLRKIDIVHKEQQSMFDTFIKLSEIPASRTHIAKVVNTITEVDINKSDTENRKDHSGYAINRTTELLTSISQEMTQKGNTLWGLLSGVTHYTTHVMPVPKRENGRLESKYTGGGLSIDNEAYNLIKSF